MRARVAALPWLMVCTGLAITVGPVTTVGAQSTDEAVRVEVVEHPLDVRPGDVLSLLVAVEGEVPDDATVVVRVYEPILDRLALKTVLDGDTGSTQDRITLAWADLARTSSGWRNLPIPTTPGPLQRGVLRLAEAGVYPLRIEVRAPSRRGGDGEVLGDTVTVVHAVTDETADHELDVSYVAHLTAPPARQPDGELRLDSAAQASLTALATLLERTSAPLSAALPPEMVDALLAGDDADQELWRRLAAGLEDREVLASPAVTLDPSTAVRSGLSDTYTTLLRRGEDTVSSLVGRGRVQRSVQVVNGSLDIPGAMLMRDLGVRSVVLTPRAQNLLGAPAGPDAPVDPTSMVALPLGSGSELPAALVDPSLARSLAFPGGPPAQQAWEIVAELLVIRYELLARLGADATTVDVALARRSISLSSPDGRPTQPDLVAQVLERVERTAGLRPVTASEAGASTGLSIVNGLTVELPLADEAGDDLSQRAEDLFVLSLDAFTVASMLPDGDPRPNLWSDQVWRLAAQELEADDVEVGLDMVRAQFDDVRRAVTVPSLNDITLGGRRSTIRLKLRNDAPFEVRVAVRLESAKLSFPNGQEVVAVPGSTTTEVEIPVEVRSNGRFPVSVTLLTPEGDVPLGTPVEFAARATALTGLGQVVTVAGALILASWWLRHGRARRRANAREDQAS